MAEETREGFYKMTYRCANCGHSYDVEVRKGTAAKGAGGTCPNCGVASGKPNIGHHETVLPTVDGKQILHG